MPDPFAALDDLVSGAVEAAFGTEIIIKPRLPGSQYVAPAPDPARPDRQVRAVFSSGPAIDTIGGQGMAGASGGTTKIGGQTLVLWLSPGVVRSIPYALRKGDGVAFVDDPVLTYEIVVPRPTNTGDLELIITRE
ncbi:hypothetical protein [Paracoccus sp. 22332]|uniref:hypothetical protein n=1 Tax=Paracoccus sp. 22332 TaxID=3453913 RepID=UPI003F875CA4